MRVSVLTLKSCRLMIEPLIDGFCGVGLDSVRSAGLTDDKVNIEQSEASPEFKEGG